MLIHQKNIKESSQASMAKVVAIVVAAGLSSRMDGAQKLLLPFRGKTMIEWVVDQIRIGGIDEIIVVTNPTISDQIPKMNSTKRVVNPDFQNGLTSSIRHGILACSSQVDGFMICLADMPFIDARVYQLLKSAFIASHESDPLTLVAPFYKKQKGNPVIFSSAYRLQLLNHLEPDGCKSILQENFKHVLKVSVDEDSILKDIDTPSDYQALIQ